MFLENFVTMKEREEAENTQVKIIEVEYDNYLVIVSLDTAGLLATIWHAGTRSIWLMTHVYPDSLVDAFSLQDDMPLS